MIQAIKIMLLVLFFCSGQAQIIDLHQPSLAELGSIWEEGTKDLVSATCGCSNSDFTTGTYSIMIGTDDSNVIYNNTVYGNMWCCEPDEPVEKLFPVTYYVSIEHGSNERGCHLYPSLAKKTISAGVKCLRSGDTLIILPGTYYDNVSSIPSGNKDYPTTIQGTEGVVWYPSITFRPTVDITGHHIHIIGPLHFKRNIRSRFPSGSILASESSRYVLLQDLTFENYGFKR